MAEGSCGNEQLPECELEENHEDHEQMPHPEGERIEFVAPAVGMEFDSYDDAYSYYNCYAREVGFRVRVKNSWFKRNSREKYGAVLCCSSQGFKRIKDVNRLRKETRTGCPAMVRMRMVNSKRWRVLEVSLEHNHSLGFKLYKAIKKFGIRNEWRSKWNSDADQNSGGLYRALVIDARGIENPTTEGQEFNSCPEVSNQLKLRKGDSQAIYNYICRMQLTNPNFFYLMDFGDDCHLRNLFWSDSRSRISSVYFGDVITIDNTCLAAKYEVPLVTFVGINHHGQSILLGCGVLGSETVDSYIWLFNAWLACSSGKSPLTIITDRCKTLQKAIARSFPMSQHRFGLSYVMKKVPEKLGGLRNYDGIKTAMTKAVYSSLKVCEFETAWGCMVQSFGVGEHKWLQSLYEERLYWVPVYLKDTFFAGMPAQCLGETFRPFFEKYVHKQTPLKEFLDKYELALEKRHKEETCADMDLRSSNATLKTRCSFEKQLSEVYTREIFKKFQLEIEEMYSCFSTTSIHVDGPSTIFLVKERVCGEGKIREIRDYEVSFNKSDAEVKCICCCFNFYGYLCRHALCVLHFNGVEEIPTKYVLSRWRKDCKRLSMPEHDSISTDPNNHSHWFLQLYRSALQAMEEGTLSLNHYNVALQAFEDSLKRVHSVQLKWKVS